MSLQPKRVLITGAAGDAFVEVDFCAFSVDVTHTARFAQGFKA